jgi:hypothetical protein
MRIRTFLTLLIVALAIVLGAAVIRHNRHHPVGVAGGEWASVHF